MGHYDNCRPENCGICGQLRGYCEHTNSELVNNNNSRTILNDNAPEIDIEEEIAKVLLEEIQKVVEEEGTFTWKEWCARDKEGWKKK